MDLLQVWISYTFLSLLWETIFFLNWCCMNKISKNIYMFRHTADLNTVRYFSILFLHLHYVSPPHPLPLPHWFIPLSLCYWHLTFSWGCPKCQLIIVTLCTLTLSSTAAVLSLWLFCVWCFCHYILLLWVLGCNNPGAVKKSEVGMTGWCGDCSSGLTGDLLFDLEKRKTNRT